MQDAKRGVVQAFSTDSLKAMAYLSGEVVYPQPKPHRLETLGETLHVYGDQVVLKASVRSNRKEGFAVRAILEYQSCDDQTCYLPDRIEFEIPLEVRDNVWD